VLDVVVKEFGWFLEIAQSLDDLRVLSTDRHIVALLIDPAAIQLSPSEALESAMEIAPRARRVLCYRFSDTMSLAEMADAGAFQTLATPLNPTEVRQCLGFVWAADRRKPANVVSLDEHPAPRRKVTPSITPKVSSTVA